MARPRSRRYWLRLLILLVVAVIVPLLGIPTFIGASAMWTLIHPGCGDGNHTPADFNLPAYREITFPAQSGGVYRGFFIPGSRDATIIVPPPYGSGRDSMLGEASILAANGYNILIYESRVCAGKGVVSLGYNEVEDVGDALAFLKQNADSLKVNVQHIALHGFSSAGATSIMAAARYPEIHAILAEGGYDNIDEQLGFAHGGNLVESLMTFGSRAAYRLATGRDVSVLKPVEAIRHLPPRPIFLVYGTREVSLPGAKEELAAAHSVDPNTFIELWLVPGATHGTYIAAVGKDEYARHVLPYYACALLDQCAAWRALWIEF